MNNNMLNMFNGFMQNPVMALMNAGVNIPQNITNNPQAIIQYMLNTGQINQGQVNQAMQTINSPLLRGLFNR